MEFELDKTQTSVGVVEIVQIEVLPPPAVESDVILPEPQPEQDPQVS